MPGTVFPTALDPLSVPAGNMPASVLMGRIALLSGAVAALQAKVGITSVAGEFPAGIVVGKASGVGIAVDDVAPTFGWRDINAALNARTSGAATPAYAAYVGTIFQYQFSNAATQELFAEYHIPHDYVPGSDVYIHIHWSQTTADSPNSVKWSFSVVAAKGHNQEAFQGAVTTVTVTQACSATVRQHMLAEVALSSGGVINGSTLEPDSVVIVRIWRDPTDVADTATQAPFVHFVDLHYQSTSLGTKQKSPNFYV